jgi:hypothetical protein
MAKTVFRWWHTPRQSSEVSLGHVPAPHHTPSLIHLDHGNKTGRLGKINLVLKTVQRWHYLQLKFSILLRSQKDGLTFLSTRLSGAKGEMIVNVSYLSKTFSAHVNGLTGSGTKTGWSDFNATSAKPKLFLWIPFLTCLHFELN